MSASRPSAKSRLASWSTSSRRPLVALWGAHGDAIAERLASHGELVPPEASQDEPTDPSDDDIPI